MKKEYKTEKQLEKLLDLETSRLMSHQTQEEYEQSKLNLITYSQDYYIVTGRKWEYRGVRI